MPWHNVLTFSVTSKLIKVFTSSIVIFLVLSRCHIYIWMPMEMVNQCNWYHITLINGKTVLTCHTNIEMRLQTKVFPKTALKNHFQHK